MRYLTRKYRYDKFVTDVTHMLWSVFTQCEILSEESLDCVYFEHNGVQYEPTFDFIVPEYRIAIDFTGYELEYDDAKGKERQVMLLKTRMAKEKLTYNNNYRWIELDPDNLNYARNQLIQFTNELLVLNTVNGKPSLLTPRLQGDAGFDVVCTESAMCEPHGYVDIPSDLFMEIPNHLYGVIQARSSTSKKRLLVLPGIIDSSFRGRIYTMVYNLSDIPVEINKGDRIAQMIFLPRAPHLHLQSVTSLRPSERGESGFGSTGH